LLGKKNKLKLDYVLVNDKKINVYRNKNTLYGHISIKNNESYYIKFENEETGVIRKYPAWTTPEEIGWLVDNIYIKTNSDTYKYTKSAIEKSHVEVFMGESKLILKFKDVLLASEIDKNK
jgi:hypothetical protein